MIPLALDVFLQKAKVESDCISKQVIKILYTKCSFIFVLLLNEIWALLSKAWCQICKVTGSDVFFLLQFVSNKLMFQAVLS